MPKDPYKNSPYDASGMPLGAETVDYDDKDAVALKTVKDKVVEPQNINDLEYDESVTVKDWQKRTKFNPALNNTAIQFPGHRIHKAHEDDIGTGIPELQKDAPKQVDMDDPKVVEEVAKDDPKETNKAKVESDSVVHDDKDDDFKKALDNA